MIYRSNCPFCEGSIPVYDISLPWQSDKDIIYLSGKCSECGQRIDAAGTKETAISEFKKLVDARIGTKPEEWRIDAKKIRAKKRSKGRR